MPTVDPATAALIDQYAAQYGVDPALAFAVGYQESGLQQFNPDGTVKRGGAGEYGMFQLMPDTAAGLGVDPTNLVQNIEGGIHNLATLLTQYHGDERTALAAYNEGSGNLAQYGVFPSTRDYVASVEQLKTQFGGGSTPLARANPDDPRATPTTPHAPDSSGDPSWKGIFNADYGALADKEIKNIQSGIILGGIALAFVTGGFLIIANNVARDPAVQSTAKTAAKAAVEL